MLTKAAAKDMVASHFRRASDKFAVMQNADNWAELEAAMWHLQRVSQMTEEQVKELLAPVPIPQWGAVFDRLNNRKG